MIPIIAQAIDIYSYVFIARAILSWFRIGDDSPFAPLVSIIYQVTEPLLAPVRSVLPRMGVFDFSVIIVIIGLRLVANFVASLA